MSRPRKPEALKELEGDPLARRNLDAPQSPSGLGSPPAHLDMVAKLAWEQVATLLDEMKVAARADSYALEIFCVNYSIWRKASERIAKDGYTIDTGHTTKPHPCFAIMHEAQRTCGRLLGQFGLTPAARSGLRIEGPDDDDELLALMGTK